MSTNEFSPNELPPPVEAVNAEKLLPPVTRQDRGGLTFLWIAVLVLAVALMWMWRDGKKSDSEWQNNTVQQLGALEEARNEQAARERQYENRLQLVQEKITALELRLNELHASRQAVEKLYRQLLPLRDDVTVREVEYRVHFAAQQLAMSGNVPVALAALQDADAELAALNRADLATVKATLAQTIETLQRMPVFDIRSFLTRFDQALTLVDQMAPQEVPVAMSPAKIAVDETAPWWRRWWAETKETVLSMVRLRIGEEVGGGNASRAHVADTALDRQELRLRLLSLRLMVLSRQPIAGVEATTVQTWLSQHFVENDPAVRTLQSLLEELASSPVSAPLPEVSPVLDALRLWRSAQPTAEMSAEGL
ncbi:MAG: uroporphyrinogen-III C-methyltransferase [Burkholderiales bacterium]|jgi:uroporphyrinogen III methyltransferase/synthase|nr:uroporphyrinogen-III C-methyltransferase [Burkholderiales bacterium]